MRSSLRALLLLGGLLPGLLQAQSLGKLQRTAINRTRITLVNGDTIQRFTTTLRRPSPKPDRFYYWQGQDHVLRTVGAYNGRLLDGPYRLTDRTDHLLGAGNLRNGLKYGTWRKWRPDGSLASSSRWRHGRQRGRTVLYDENSRPLAVPRAVPSAPPAATPGTTASPLGWWQPARWKVKFKRPRTKTKEVAPAPNPNGPVVPPAAPAKRRGFFKKPAAPAPPKPAGS